jgi:hypothetical protein
MSKLDQIKALGAAKAASRNSSDGGVGKQDTRRIDDPKPLGSGTAEGEGPAGSERASRVGRPTKVVAGLAPDPSDTKARSSNGRATGLAPLGEGRSSTKEPNPVVAGSNPAAPAKKRRSPNGTFDRTAYQRELMRKRRQKEGKK